MEGTRGEVCVCVCVCVRERERERGRLSSTLQKPVKQVLTWLEQNCQKVIARSEASDPLFSSCEAK